MRRILPFAIALLCQCITTIAQVKVVRPYGLVKTYNIKGGHTMFGNTSMRTPAESQMNEFNGSGTYYDALAASYGLAGFTGMTSLYMNNDQNMQFLDADASQSATLVSLADKWDYFEGSIGAYTTSPDWSTVSNNEVKQANGPFRFNMGLNGKILGTSELDSIRTRNTYYFRKTVNINKSNYSAYTLTVNYDDGVIVYINGKEIGRKDMPTGIVSYSTSASSCNTGSNFRSGTFQVFPGNILNGNNIITVEVHQGPNCAVSPVLPDMYFDLQLRGYNNSSSADLVLPAGTNTIRFARWYWGGKYVNGAFPDSDLKSVKLKKNGKTFQVVNTTVNPDKWAISSTVTSYQNYADITDYISTNGAGRYTVADIAASNGNVANGAYAGWSIVVVYENDNLPYNSVRVFDGLVSLSTGGAAVSHSITLNDLNVPDNNLTREEAYVSAMVWEGEANLAATSSTSAGDFLKINGIRYSDAVNPATNMWNGTISKNGALVSTKLPDYKNQMGIDIDEIQIGSGYGIKPNDRSAIIELGTEYDEYFSSVLAFTIRMKDPEVSLKSTVVDVNGGDVLLNEQLLYTISGTNAGTGTAYNTVVTNTISPLVTLVPSSIEVFDKTLNTWIPIASSTNVKYSITDNVLQFFIGTGATTTRGGSLAVDENYGIRFNVTVNSYGTISNTTNLTDYNGANVLFNKTSMSDIVAVASILPVTFKDFSGKIINDYAFLKWTTASEENTSHFEIERSFDGHHFEKTGQISAVGKSNNVNAYQFNDSSAINKFQKAVYYRLKVVDLDEKTEYSKVIALSLEKTFTINNLSIYPNPINNGSQLKLQIKADNAQSAVIRFINFSGYTLLSLNKKIQAGDNAITLYEFNQLKPGLYIIEIVTGTGKYKERILKLP